MIQLGYRPSLKMNQMIDSCIARIFPRSPDDLAIDIIALNVSLDLIVDPAAGVADYLISQLLRNQMLP